ncbi:MAG: MFS transporter [Micrococcales bacterium]
MKPWLTRNVWTLSWVSFLQDAASEMLYPLMPILLTSLLHAPAAIVGMIEGLAEGVAATTKLLSNTINRWVPRKLMVLLGYAGAGLGKLIIAAAGAWPLVLLGRLTDRVGKGLRSAPRDALLIQGSEKEHRGKIIGFHRTADTLGAVLGPILALALLAAFDNNVRDVLWFAALPALLSVLMVLPVQDKQRSQRTEARLAAQAAAAGDAEAGALLTKPHEPLSARLRLIMTIIVGFAVVNFPDALILLHVSQIGFSVTAVVGAYLLYNVSYAALNFPAGWLADKLSPNQIYAFGLLLFAIAYGGMGLTSNASATLALLVVYGGFAAVNDTVGKSWVSKLAPESRQLWAQSLLQGLSGFGLLAAGFWAGLLWTLNGGLGGVPLLVSGAIALVAATAMALIGRD